HMAGAAVAAAAGRTAATAVATRIPDRRKPTMKLLSEVRVEAMVPARRGSPPARMYEGFPRAYPDSRIGARDAAARRSARGRRRSGEARGERGEVGAVRHAGLGQQVGDVFFDGTRRQEQPSADLLIAQPGRDQAEHLVFADRDAPFPDLGRERAAALPVLRHRYARPAQ